MRAFLAIPLPEHVKKEIDRVQKRFYLRNIQLKYVQDPHITLAFLGNIEDPQPLIEKLNNITFQKFTAKLGTIQCIPDSKDPKVVWIAVEPQIPLEDLHQTIAKAIDYHEKEYRPHITIARVKHIAHKKDFKEMIDQIKVNNEKFEVDRFILYKSTLTKEGPEYEEIKEWKLGESNS